MIDQFSKTLDIMEELLSQDYQMTQLIILRNPFIQKPFGSFSLKIESKYGQTNREMTSVVYNIDC